MLRKAFKLQFLRLFFLNSNPYKTAYTGLCRRSRYSGNLCYNMVEEQSYNALHNNFCKDQKGYSSFEAIVIEVIVHSP